MFNICYRMMGNKEEAQDMLQESFTDAFKRLESFRYEATFGAWLKRIVVNHCINEIKRRKTELVFFDDMHLFQQRSDEEEMLPEVSVPMIRRAMEELPNGSKMIFSLYLLEGMDHGEIAQILGVSESNSKSQYMRAKQRIRDILKEVVYEN
ncbi:MAG: sigma-70 family RNA polymerase sigma factor [Bacteroidetes bacterium]|nr:sigma-70 family RNA polymerase sigma factor [Bacteroidota bacterium]